MPIIFISNITIMAYEREKAILLRVKQAKFLYFLPNLVPRRGATALESPVFWKISYWRE
jgi:hypothetical protein